MFKRLAHVCIGAINLAETEHFYIDLLGMDKAFDFYRDDRQIGFYLRAGESTFIEVFVERAYPKRSVRSSGTSASKWTIWRRSSRR